MFCKIKYNFFQWLYYGSIDRKIKKTRIIKIKSWRSFLTEDVDGRRSEYFEWLSPFYLFMRIIGLESWYYKKLNKSDNEETTTEYYNNGVQMDTSSGNW